MSRIADLRVIGERFSTSVVDGQPLLDGRKGRLVIVADVITWAVKRIEQANITDAVSRVWTLAGCLAVVVERPQEDLLREVTGIDTLDRRADLYTLSLAGLERCAELLEQAHMQAVCELEARPNDDARLP